MDNDKFLAFVFLYLLLIPTVLIGLPIYYHAWDMLAVTIPISLAGWYALWWSNL